MHQGVKRKPPLLVNAPLSHVVERGGGEGRSFHEVRHVGMPAPALSPGPYRKRESGANRQQAVLFSDQNLCRIPATAVTCDLVDDGESV